MDPEITTVRVGTALQLGMMALTTRGVPYRPDWLIKSLDDLGEREFYRYRVRGVNLNFDPSEPGYLFSWSVPALCWRFFWAEPGCDAYGHGAE